VKAAPWKRRAGGYAVDRGDGRAGGAQGGGPPSPRRASSRRRVGGRGRLVTIRGRSPQRGQCKTSTANRRKQPETGVLPEGVEARVRPEGGDGQFAQRAERAEFSFGGRVLQQAEPRGPDEADSHRIGSTAHDLNSSRKVLNPACQSRFARA
jgi:hypothetical protein